MSLSPSPHPWIRIGEIHFTINVYDYDEHNEMRPETDNVDPVYKCYVEGYILYNYGNFLMCPFHLGYSIKQLWVHV